MAGSGIRGASGGRARGVARDRAARTQGITLTPLIEPDVLRLDFASTTLALPFLALIVLVVPAVAFWVLTRGGATDGFRLALFVLAMIGVFLAQSVAAYFLAWELMSLVSAFLVGAHYERHNVQRALLSYILVRRTLSADPPVLRAAPDLSPERPRASRAWRWAALVSGDTRRGVLSGRR
jgi:hypothetical protein